MHRATMVRRIRRCNLDHVLDLSPIEIPLAELVHQLRLRLVNPALETSLLQESGPETAAHVGGERAVVEGNMDP